jgi:metal-responsive CopG/Arc/MetJ family transcriptional regulator
MSRGTIHRTLRVEDDLWGAAKSIADGRGENLSEILRQALRDYVSQHEGTEEAPDVSGASYSSMMRVSRFRAVGVMSSG